MKLLLYFLNPIHILNWLHNFDTSQDMEYVDSTDPDVCCGTCEPKGCYHNNTRYSDGEVIPGDKKCMVRTCDTNNGPPQWSNDKITCQDPRRYCLKVSSLYDSIVLCQAIKFDLDILNFNAADRPPSLKWPPQYCSLKVSSNTNFVKLVNVIFVIDLWFVLEQNPSVSSHSNYIILMS